MTKTEILQSGAPVLREKALRVPIKDISSPRIQGVINNMKKALRREPDGVAIAAPQIGESLRIFVVSSKALKLDRKNRKDELDTDFDDLVFINPEIIKSSRKRSRVEEGCLSVRWLYGKVLRSEKVVLKAHDENGELVERGSSGLLAQIFQHELDHLDGILFTDKAEDVKDIPPTNHVKYVFFGSSKFSEYVLEELESAGFYPMLHVNDASKIPSLEELSELEADVFVVASFGKILPKELIDMPKFKSINVHPSLLPKLRGPSPIQNTILSSDTPGVTVIRMDEEMDHGPILAQTKVPIEPWPNHYDVAEEALGRVGGRILTVVLPQLIEGKIPEIPQDDALATYTKLVKKEDGLINLNDDAQSNLLKVLAYSTWPGAYMIYKNKRDKEIRVIVKDAEIVDGKFMPKRVIPAGKREMSWQDFLRGN